MGKAWSILKWTIIGITGVFLATVAFLLLWIDPNDYRDDVSKLVKDKTGLVLQIKGDIGWQFYPAVGFSVADISLAASDSEPPIASIGSAAVSVEVMPLFFQQVNVRTLYVDKLVANLVVDAEGKGNWEALAGQQEAAPEPPPAEGAKPDVLIRIPKVVVSNTIIDYEDQKSLAHQTVTITELVAENVGLGQEFPFHLVATLADRSGINVQLDTRAFLRLNPEEQMYEVRGLEFAANIAGILAKPFKLNLGMDMVADMTAKKILLSRFVVDASDLAVTARPLSAKVEGPIAVDLGADTATVGPLAFSAATVNGKLDVAVTSLTKTETLAFTGNLDIAPFDPKNAMRIVGIAPPETTDPLAMTKVAFKTAFEGAMTRAMLNDLAITLDETHVTGNAGITDVATQALAFDLKVDGINADRYLPPAAKPAAGEKATAEAPAPATADAKPAGKPAPLLPVETLRTLNIDGKLAVGKITVMEWPMTNLSLALKAKDGDIRLDPFGGTVLDGTVGGNVRIDARGDDPRIVTNIKLNRVEIGGLVKRFAKKDLLTGRTSLNVAVDTTGNDVDTLIKRAVGTMDLTFADAVLKGANLNGILTEALTQQLGAFSMLVPDYQQRLPKELKGDTAFKTLTAKGSVKEGVASVPAINAAAGDATIKGGGDFNILTKDFEYRMAMRSEKLKDNKYVGNMEFPMVCKGNVAGAPGEWCKIDSKLIREQLKDAAENAAKDRIKGEIAKQLGVETLDTKVIKEEAKKQVQEKAKEEMNKQMMKAFEKYL